jgi:hypothetical protein
MPSTTGLAQPWKHRESCNSSSHWPMHRCSFASVKGFDHKTDCVHAPRAGWGPRVTFTGRQHSLKTTSAPAALQVLSHGCLHRPMPQQGWPAMLGAPGGACNLQPHGVARACSGGATRGGAKGCGSERSRARPRMGPGVCAGRPGSRGSGRCTAAVHPAACRRWQE